ncbi:MAG TPA: hypothetical protein PJ982_06865 [Lacipirellulaceae bacterium]|nr:hypothetical protein [Lacipirellulaceae bacterium]
MVLVCAVVVLMYIGGQKVRGWMAASRDNKPVGRPASSAAPERPAPLEPGIQDIVDQQGVRHWSEMARTATGELVRQGAYESWYPGGGRRSAGRHDDGLRTGEWKFWAPQGTLLSVQTFAEGEPTGPYVLYHPNGRVHAQGELLAGKRHGCWEYFDEVGIRLKVERFDNGRSFGTWEAYDSLGRLRLVFSPTGDPAPDYRPADDTPANCGCG